MSLIELYLKTVNREPIQCGEYTIQILCEKLVGVYKEERPHVNISIRTPESEKVKLSNNPSRKASLFLEFDDFDDLALEDKYMKDAEGNPIRKICLFKKEHARMILDFLKIQEGRYEAIVINCQAGISRSAAVGAALSKIYCDNDAFFFKWYVPNKRVYRILLEEYYLRSENENTKRT